MRRNSKRNIDDVRSETLERVVATIQEVKVVPLNSSPRIRVNVKDDDTSQGSSVSGMSFFRYEVID